MAYFLLTLIVIAALVVPPERAGAQAVRTHMLADTVLIGERFELAVAIDRPEGYDFTLPELIPGESSLGDLEILSLKTRRTYHPLDRRIDSLVYTVTTFAVDEARIPPLNVMFASAADTVFVASAPGAVPVRSTVPEGADGILDLAPLAEFPRPWLFWAVIALAVILLAAAAYLLYSRYRRRPARGAVPEVEPRAPAETPYEEAKARLVALARRFPLSEADLKPFFVELSDLLRTYIGRTTGIPALEMTSSELKGALHRAEARGRNEIDRESLELLDRVLDLADFVKFADGRPDEPAVWLAFESTSRLIDKIERLYNPPRLPADGEVLESSTETPA